MLSGSYEHDFVRYMSITSCYDEFVSSCVGKLYARVSQSCKLDPGCMQGWASLYLVFESTAETWIKIQRGPFGHAGPYTAGV